MDQVPTDFSTLTDFDPLEAMALETPETAAAGPEGGGKGPTRTPPVAAVRDGENLDNPLDRLMAEYGVADRGRFQGANGQVRHMIARAYRMGAASSRRPRVKVPRDSADMAEAIERLVMSMGRRARAGDLEALTGLTTLEDAVKRARTAAAQGLHFDHGYTWAEVGRAAGITRSAAEQRWGG